MDYRGTQDSMLEINGLQMGAMTAFTWGSETEIEPYLSMVTA